MNVTLRLALIIVVVFTSISLSFFGLIPKWLSLICVIFAGIILMVENRKDNEEESTKKTTLVDTK